MQYLERGHWRTADLVFENERPILVVSWRTTAHERLPYVCFNLDPDALELIDSLQRIYRYHGRLGKPCNTRSVWALLHSHDLTKSRPQG